MTSSSLAQAICLSLTAVLATRLLGPHERGLMVLGATSAGIAALIGGMGTGPALRSRLPNRTAPAQRAGLLAAYTWCSLGSIGLAAGLATAASTVCAAYIDPGLAAAPFVVAVVVATAGSAALIQFPDLWFAAGQFRTGGGWAAVTAGAGLLGVAAGAMVDRSAATLLLAHGLGMVAAAGVQTVRLRAAGLWILRRPARRELTYLTHHGVRALGLTVGLTLAMRADRYVLGAVSGSAVVGIYSVAATLSEVPRLVPAALGQLANREIALRAGRFGLTRPVLQAVCSAAVISLGVAAAGWLLIVPVFGTEFAGTRPLLLVLLGAEVLFAPFAVASRGLLGGGWTATAGVLGLAGSAGAVALYALTIPVWGAYGAATAGALSYLALSVASWLALHRHLTEARRTRDDAPTPGGPRGRVRTG